MNYPFSVFAIRLDDALAKLFRKNPLAYNREIAFGCAITGQETLPEGFKPYGAPVRKINGEMRFQASGIVPPTDKKTGESRPELFAQTYTLTPEAALENRMGRDYV